MSLTFPTRPTIKKGTPQPPGQPVRASHCHCAPPMMLTGQDTCLRCGRHPNATISDTWARRAAEISRRQAKRQGHTRAD